MKKDVLELRPTQFVLGMKEVEAKIAKITKLVKSNGLDGKEMHDWLEERKIPCVAGPSNHTYLIDHHHLLSACYHCGVKKVEIEIVANKSTLPMEEFWTFMRASHWVYLYDQFGNGPHDPARLPLDIRGLSDDLYRSLAWELRQAGLIEKVQKPFSEFKWAAYLRKNCPVDLHEISYEEAVARAVTAAKTQLARGGLA